MLARVAWWDSDEAIEEDMGVETAEKMVEEVEEEEGLGM